MIIFWNVQIFKKIQIYHQSRELVRVPKGQKSIIQEFAKNQGKSLNAYIVELINEDMAKHKN